MTAGLPQGRRPELQGGGLLRSLGGWQAVTQLRRGREAYLGDERILGGTEFVEQLRRTVAERGPTLHPRLTLDVLIACVCRHVGLPPAHLAAGNRRPAASRARAGIAYLWTTVLGHPGRPLAPVLGIRPQNVYRAAAQGQAAGAEWERLLTTC